ncbi:hypothetical protein CDAR_609211 [Caerostris darwini]|uniref:Uncharacterized protein n=1 Tax=Caerostris darwini TaxID=1538125 RepID=A0AAV4PVN8_9ARAC|nr:hypothetical protein CDAR_609211 [Caerostris darwini]
MPFRDLFFRKGAFIVQEQKISGVSVLGFKTVKIGETLFFLINVTFIIFEPHNQRVEGTKGPSPAPLFKFPIGLFHALKKFVGNPVSRIRTTPESQREKEDKSSPEPGYRGYSGTPSKNEFPDASKYGAAFEVLRCEVLRKFHFVSVILVSGVN